jgi:hypothetical protein
MHATYAAANRVAFIGRINIFDCKQRDIIIKYVNTYSKKQHISKINMKAK